MVFSQDKTKKLVSWICRCDCGVTRSVNGGNLRRGLTVSCGCYNDENRVLANIKHGGQYIKEYRVWCGMIQRCENPNAGKYRDYGARGIKICRRFRDSFGDFFRDIGPRPSPRHSIDRIDNSKGYFCGKCEDCQSKGCSEPNCRWSSPMQQCRNKRNNVVVEIEGARMCASDAAKRMGLPYKAFMARLYMGWPIQRALYTPLRK